MAHTGLCDTRIAGHNEAAVRQATAVMKVGERALHLLQVLILLVVPLDAFALAPGRVGGDKRQPRSCLAEQPTTRPWRQSRLPPMSSTPDVAAVAEKVAGGGDDAKPIAEEDKSTMSQSVFNLVKNVMGAGMLSLPNGVSAFSDSRNAIIPATGIVAALGALSAYTFCLIGRSCAKTGAASYEQSWARSVGERTAWVPAAGCVATCFAGCLAYTLIIGDSFSALAETFNAPAAVANRSNVILGLSLTVLLPLSLLRNLKSLGFTSMLGTTGLFYTAVMMGVRFFDGSYAKGGKFHALLPDAGVPIFGARGANPVRFLVSVLVSMLSTAYEAHFNAPLFYRELKNNTVSRYTKMVSASFVATIVTMAAVTAFGFLTFGGASSGYILNNYANSDRLAAIARIFVATSIVFSYPFCFVGLRDGIREMLGAAPGSQEGRTPWTIGLLGLVSAVALKITDLGFVNSFCGALIGSGIIYVFPAMMFLKPVREQLKSSADKLKGLRREFLANRAIVVTGVVMGALGAAVSVLESFTDVLG